jgi:hypothetical protein
LEIETVTEGPSPEHEIAPLLRRVHDAAVAAERGLATSRASGKPPSESADTATDVRRRYPEYDNLIAGLAVIFETHTGAVPGFSDRPAHLEHPRSLVGHFLEFARAALPVIGRAFPDLGLENDPDWRRLIDPTPDEIREAYRRIARRMDSKPGSADSQ